MKLSKILQDLLKIKEEYGDPWVTKIDIMEEDNEHFPNQIGVHMDPVRSPRVPETKLMRKP